MSSTTSDRLTLLSYATFNYHIPIHDHSGSTWRQHQWKQAETMIALAISLTECQEALSERQFGKQMCDSYFVWSWRSRTKRRDWFLNIYFTDVFWDISFENEI